jgi:5-methylcytosine-specific restriction endonuclease McrA
MATRRGTFAERGYDAEYERNRQLVLEQESLCWVCHLWVDKRLPPRHPLSASVVHRIPRSEGGGNERGNLSLAHYRCNSAGGAAEGRGRTTSPNPGRPLLLTGRPLGGLLIVPLVAIWVRRAAESGRFTRFSKHFAKPS